MLTLHRNFTGSADWFSPSGGLAWHMRALRWRSGWRAFAAAISWWLDTWQHGSSGLLLLGPSAGWCLPDRFLGGFSHIHAVDLDPLAPFLFQCLHGAALARHDVRLSWQRGNLFEEIGPLLERHPRHAVLFANVLGQHGLHQREPGRAEADLAGLVARLQGRRWASFHDRLSGAWSNGRAVPGAFRRAAVEDAPTLARVAGGGTWIDHLTAAVLPADCPRLLLPWPIRPGRLHWVEAGHVE